MASLPIHYDEINRLTRLERGDYGSDESIDSDSFAEEWSLDWAGNWSNCKRDTTPDGTWDVDHAVPVLHLSESGPSTRCRVS
jgi:hypothetical protein